MCVSAVYYGNRRQMGEFPWVLEMRIYYLPINPVWREYCKMTRTGNLYIPHRGAMALASGAGPMCHLSEQPVIVARPGWDLINNMMFLALYRC
jgi:hypothetical protein